MIGQFATVVDISGTAIALPRIAADLDLDIAAAAWVTVATVLAIISALLPMGRVADVIGRRSVYLVGLMAMAAGLAASASSPGLALLLIGRVVTGLGSAMVMIAAVSIITVMFPIGERGRVLGMLMFVVGLGAVTGPVVSGALVDAFGWRALFAFTGTLAMTGWIVAVTTLRAEPLRPSGSASAQQIDLPGAILSTGALALLILAVTNGNRLGWTSLIIAGGFTASAAFFAGFVWWERVAASPMIDLSIFGVRQFSWTLTARFCGFFTNGPTNFLMPFYLQEVTGRSAAEAGFLVAPLPLAMAVVGAVAGSLSDRLGTRTFILSGLWLQIGTLLSFSMFDRSTSVTVILASMLLHGVGSGLWMAPNMSWAVGAVSTSVHGVAAALVNLARSVANVTSVAVSTAIVAGVTVSGGASSANGGTPVDQAEAVDALVTGMHTVFRSLIGATLLAMIATTMAGRAVSSGSGHRRSTASPLR